jgi:hypothetical protein
MTYSNVTTDADPGNGVIRFNNNSVPSATAAFIDMVDANGNDIQSYIRALDNWGVTPYGFMTVMKDSVPNVQATFQITSETDATGYNKLGLILVSFESSAFVSGDTVWLFFDRSITPANMVTTDSAQTVVATKTFAPATDIKPLRVLRGTDASPAARLLEFRNHADNADLLYVDQNGNLAGNVVSGLSGSFFTSAAGGSAPTTARRWVGGMAGLGAPTSGTWGAGDFVIDDYGNVWICTAAGTPGTWSTPAQFLRGTQMLHNGEFMVCQRGTSGVGSTNTVANGGRSGFDRWAVYRAGYAAGATWSQQLGPLNISTYSARVGRASANASTASINLVQAMLTADAMDLVSVASTISFYASAGANYSAASGLLTVTVTSGTGTDEGADAAYTGSATVVTTTVTLTGAWQKFTVAVPAPATSATELKVTFGYTPVGTAGAADYFNIAAVQWEPGLIARAYDRMDFAAEMRRCQYFYNRVQFPSGTTIGPGAYYSATVVYFAIAIPVMRTAPVVTASNLTSAINAAAAGASHVSTALTIAAGQMGPNMVELNATTPAAAVGQAAIVRANGALFVECSAEI